MKNNTRMLVLAALLAAGSVHAQSYLGRICFTSTVTARQTGPVAAQAVPFVYDATNVGGSSYTVVGYATTADQPFVATGFGVLLNGELYLSMTTTQTHADGWKDTGINQTRLSLATLSGTFYEIGHDFNPATRQFDTRYTSGTVARTPCP